MVRTASEPTATRTRSHPGRIRTKFLQSRSPIRVALTTFADKPLATRGSSPLAPRLAGPPRVARGVAPPPLLPPPREGARWSAAVERTTMTWLGNTDRIESGDTEPSVGRHAYPG